jgi:hypothetical protein
MSPLCRARRKCLAAVDASAKAGQGNDCQRNKMGKNPWFHSSDYQRSDDFFCLIHLSFFLKGTANGGKIIFALSLKFILKPVKAVKPIRLCGNSVNILQNIYKRFKMSALHENGFHSVILSQTKSNRFLWLWASGSLKL